MIPLIASASNLGLVEITLIGHVKDEQDLKKMET